MKVLDLVKNIKRDYINKYGDISYIYERPCILEWAEKLGNSDYLDMLKYLKLKQKGNYVIIKYLPFEVLFSKGFSYTDFWNMYDGIYRECRGITIDVAKEQIVTLPFPKFFNINEQEETSECNIRKRLKNAKSVEFANKLDGSLVITRWYDNNLFLSSSGIIEGNDVIKYSLKVANQDNYIRLIKDFSDYTVMFEGIFFGIEHVVKYSKEQNGLYLIGMRNVNNGTIKKYSEIVEIAKKYGIKCTDDYMMTFDEILSSRGNYSHTEKEGYVMNVDGFLVKIKCDDYILLNKALVSNCSSNNIIKCIYEDKIDDLKSAMSKDYYKHIDDVINTVSEYCKIMEIRVNEYLKNAPTDRIEFFKYVDEIPNDYKRYVIAKYDGKNLSYLIASGKNNSFVKFSKMQKIINFNN